MSGCGASPDCSKVVRCCKAFSLEEWVQVYTYRPSFGRETTMSTGERDGRSSEIYADHRGVNALLLWFILLLSFVVANKYRLVHLLLWLFL